jgi:restriction system protein
MQTRFGEIKIKHSARGLPTYSIELFHDGLIKHQELRASDHNVLLNKANTLALKWNADWHSQQELQARIRRTHESKEAKRLYLEHRKNQALQGTMEAEQAIATLRNTLLIGLGTDPTINWEAAKNLIPFPQAIPARPIHPADLPAPATPAPPDKSDFRYRPVLSLFDKIFASRKAATIAAYAERFQSDLKDWERRCAALTAEYEAALQARASLCTRLTAEFEAAVAAWNEANRDYNERAALHNNAIDQFREKYLTRERDVIIEYCERVLAHSEYPSCIPRDFDFELNTDTGMLLVSGWLPAPDDLPKLAEVKYVQTTDSAKEVMPSEIQASKLYDDLVYQIVLRTLHELFQSDSIKALSTVVFNGYVTSTDRSTGNKTTACILSVQVAREPFLAINLAKVDPKACFRQLKGVGSSKLHSVTPVAPIVDLNRSDRRFIPSHDVAGQLNSGYNLATMDWEEFEHLVREIFQKEFSSSGGEVKVTQASRDGGVDAIAFDPDPIRGGKIVIQAKRYAHTVGASAVRDLYGTVLNEGASKGILVTTSDYGPDAYEFANGKPLTLLSGSNLLHLLTKQGITAHIDLAAARKLGQERASQAKA